MGASLRTYFCSGIAQVNGLPLLRTAPSSYSTATVSTIGFLFEANALKIMPNFDELINTDSVVNQNGLEISILKNSKGIATRREKIGQIISDLLRKEDDRKVEKVVFAEPPCSDANKEIIFEAIFYGIHNFTTTHKPNYLRAVYLDWKALSQAQMTAIV